MELWRTGSDFHRQLDGHAQAANTSRDPWFSQRGWHAWAPQWAGAFGGGSDPCTGWSLAIAWREGAGGATSVP